MVKFIATNEETGRKILGLGLSHGNVAKLMLKQPIHINAEQLSGMAMIQVHEILIFVGETEAAIAEEFEKNGWLGDAPVLTDKADTH